MQHMLYNFEVGHIAAEANKNICFAKFIGAVDQSTVTWWFEKFFLGCENLDDQASRP